MKLAFLMHFFLRASFFASFFLKSSFIKSALQPTADKFYLLFAVISEELSPQGNTAKSFDKNSLRVLVKPYISTLRRHTSIDVANPRTTLWVFSINGIQHTKSIHYRKPIITLGISLIINDDNTNVFTNTSVRRQFNPCKGPKAVETGCLNQDVPRCRTYN